MFNPLTLLTGSAGPWIVLGGFLAGLASGGTGGYIARGIIDAPALSAEKAKTAQAQAATSDCKATHEASRADGAENALTAVTTAAQAAKAASDSLNAQAAQRNAAEQDFRNAIAALPKSFACGASEPELAYRRSVQPNTPAVPAAP